MEESQPTVYILGTSERPRVSGLERLMSKIDSEEEKEMKNVRELWEVFIRYLKRCDFTRTDGKLKTESENQYKINGWKKNKEVGDFEVHRGKECLKT